MINKLKNNELIYGSLINFSVKLLSFALTYYVMYLFINNYGIEFYGKYNLYVTFITIIGILVLFGTDVFFLKNIVILNNQTEKLNFFIKILKIIAINFVVVGTILVLFSFFQIPKNYLEKNSVNVYLVISLSLLFALTSIFISGLRGTKKILIYSISERFLLGFCLALSLSGGIHLLFKLETILFLAYFINFIIISLFFIRYVFIKKDISLNSKGINENKNTQYKVANIYRETKFIFISAILIILISKTDTFFLSVFYDLESVGFYNVILQMSFLINFAMSSINGILSPMVSKMYAQRDFVLLEKILSQANKIILATSVLTGIALIIFVKPIFLLFKIQINSLVFWTLIILVIAQIISASMGSIINLLNMSGHFKEVSSSITLSFIINLILCWILIPHYGLIGAAISTAMGIISKDLISTVYGFRVFNFKFSTYDKRRKIDRNKR